jgi:tetratricopeptide (TPR) repeat protein
LAYSGKGETSTAKTALLKALELNPKLTNAKLLLASHYLREGAYNMAEKESAEVLADFPQNYQAQLVFGNACLNQQKMQAAQGAFETLVTLQPENPVGHYRLGLLQQSLKQHDAARASFEKALELNSKLLDVFSALIQAEVVSGNFDAALEKCDRQLELVDPSSMSAAIIHDLKGGIYLTQKNLTAAEASFQEALAQDPNYLKPYYELARLYQVGNQQEKAIAQYQALLEKKPGQAEPHVLLGTLYEMQNKSELAEEHYRKALEITPDFGPAANNLAYILAAGGKDIDEALKYAQIAKGKLPHDPSVADTLGWVYYKKGLYDSAIHELRDSAEKIPANPEVHYHLGMAYFKKQENDLAKASLEKALSLKPDFNGAEEARKTLAEL